MEVEAWTRGRRAVAIGLEAPAATPGRLMLALARSGLSRLIYPRAAGGWARRPPAVAVLQKVAQRLSADLSRLLQVSTSIPGLRIQPRRSVAQSSPVATSTGTTRSRESEPAPGPRHFRDWGRLLRERDATHTRRKEAGRTTILVAHLNSGGAERQACNLAIALKRFGHPVQVLTLFAAFEEDAHFADLLQDAGVPFWTVGEHWNLEAQRELSSLLSAPGLIEELPSEITTSVLDTAGELLADPPDVLHCYLDLPNIVGGFAALLTGIRRVILSTRNVNPSRFPYLHRPWQQGCYRFLAQIGGFQLLANSEHGARDYADWIGVSDSLYEVIPNAVVAPSVDDFDASVRGRLRASLEVAPRSPFLLGVFRLSPEKNPRDFVDVVRRVREKLPDVQAAIAGVGPLRDELEEEIRASGLATTIRLLGQRKDVPLLMASADVLLLPSSYEGMPNVVLEAQAMRCPCVATAVGGTTEIVEDDHTGFLCSVGDIEGMARCVVRLLREPELRDRVIEAAALSVRKRNDLSELVARTLAIYDRTEPRAPRLPRVEMRRE